jgi:hypothetical protein
VSRAIFVHTKYVEGLYVKRYEYNWNFVGTQGWKCKIVAENLFLFKIWTKSKIANNARAFV